MKKIIRSLAWSTQAEKPLATKNYGVTVPDRLLASNKTEREILEYLVEFYTLHGEAPSLTVVYDEFENRKNAEASTFVQDTMGEQFYSGSSYEQTFENEVEEQTVQKLVTDCKQAILIAKQGILVQGTQIKGPDEAVSFLVSTAQGVPPSGKGKLPADMKKAEQGLISLYDARKNNPKGTYGIPTGYGLIDTTTGGIRKGQFYIHAGVQSHLKSTFMFNMIVTAAATFGFNPLLFTSEMPKDEVMLMMVAIHSGNDKFASVGRPLNSFQLLLGNLQPADEAFFKVVLDDLVNSPDHGRIRVVDTSEFRTFGSVMQRTIREDTEMEVDMLWVDYVTRLPVDAKYAKLQLTDARNETLADVKRFAMEFKKGQGLAVGSPFQVNREGYKRALESKPVRGKMDIRCLAQYNAAEKEADIISYGWYDDEEVALNEPKLGMIKNRWGGRATDPMPCFLDPDSRRIKDLGAGMMVVNGAPTSSRNNAEEEVSI